MAQLTVCLLCHIAPFSPSCHFLTLAMNRQTYSTFLYGCSKDVYFVFSHNGQRTRGHTMMFFRFIRKENNKICWFWNDCGSGYQWYALYGYWVDTWVHVYNLEIHYKYLRVFKCIAINPKKRIHSYTLVVMSFMNMRPWTFVL